MQHLIDLDDYPVSWWNRVIALGKDIYTNPGRYKGACSGKVMGTLFYEPSTRTQMSFQTAMLRLGGSLIGFDNPATSSVSKGENLKDTTTIVSGYSDVLVIRHPLEGAAQAAALTAECPVINAGDGGHLHPTQTLTDMLTLTMEKGRLSGLTIGMCGDLLNGRTVHSLCKALSCYPDNKFIFISTPELMVPQYVKDILNSHGCEYREVSSLEETIPELDVLYMTRIQSERFASVEEYEAQKNVYVLDRKKLNLGKSDLRTRVNTLRIETDDALPYHVGSYSFRPNAGLYFLVRGTYDISGLLEQLSYAGLGGKRSSGYGRFTFSVVQTREPMLTSAASTDATSNILLATATPREDELNDVLLDGARYRLIRKGGFVQSATHSATPTKKRDMYLFATGSSFPRTFEGDVFDVNTTPGSHPVYRYARAFWMAV